MSYFEELHPEMDAYLEVHSSTEPDILKQIRKETHQKTTQPHMISGIQQGRCLSILSKILQPKVILEIGTFTGYATLCLAEGLSKEGRIITLDINKELAYLPKKYFESSKYASQIDFRLENALQYLDNTAEIFDLVFIDADKENYIEYFNKVKNKLSVGGIILIDNVIWYGNILKENPKEKRTQIIKKLNEMIAKDPDFDNVILPIRDGIHLIRKIA